MTHMTHEDRNTAGTLQALSTEELASIASAGTIGGGQKCIRCATFPKKKPRRY